MGHAIVVAMLCAPPKEEPGTPPADFQRFIRQLYPELLAQLKCWIVANPGKMIVDRWALDIKEWGPRPYSQWLSEEDRDFFLAQLV